MPRKAAQVPGAVAPVVDNATNAAPDTQQAQNETAGKVDAADVDAIREAAAAPVAAEAAKEIDPTTLTRAVLTDKGWLCPQPKLSATRA